MSELDMRRHRADGTALHDHDLVSGGMYPSEYGDEWEEAIAEAIAWFEGHLAGSASLPAHLGARDLEVSFARRMVVQAPAGGWFFDAELAGDPVAMSIVLDALRPVEDLEEASRISAFLPGPEDRLRLDSRAEGTIFARGPEPKIVSAFLRSDGDWDCTIISVGPRFDDLYLIDNPCLEDCGSFRAAVNRCLVWEDPAAQLRDDAPGDSWALISEEGACCESPSELADEVGIDLSPAALIALAAGRDAPQTSLEGEMREAADMTTRDAARDDLAADCVVA